MMPWIPEAEVIGFDGGRAKSDRRGSTLLPQRRVFTKGFQHGRNKLPSILRPPAYYDVVDHVSANAENGLIQWLGGREDDYFQGPFSDATGGPREQLRPGTTRYVASLPVNSYDRDYYQSYLLPHSYPYVDPYVPVPYEYQPYFVHLSTQECQDLFHHHAHTQAPFEFQ